LNKYLPAQTLGSNENHGFSLQFFSAPPSVSTPLEFNDLYNSIPYNGPGASGQSSYLIPTGDITGIRNLRFATEFMPSPEAGFISNTRCLTVTLDKVDGTQQQAYMWTYSGHDGFVKMKEATPDTALYNPDCQTAFAGYFNSQFQSSYTYAQLEQIYQASCGTSLQACPSCDTLWTVYNPGNNLAIDEDLYSRSYNNIQPYSQHFETGNFIAPPSSQPGHYILVNKQTTLATGADTSLTVKWRVQLLDKKDYVNPIAKTIGAMGTNNWVGATWETEIGDTTWMIGTTIINRVGDINFLSGLGLSSNSHTLKADYVKVYNSQNQLIYSDHFAARCTNPLIAGRRMMCNNPNGDDVVDITPDGPCADSTGLATIWATDKYRAYQDSLRDVFNNLYTQKCLAAASLESFTVTHQVQEYHYTLYYYDQAGNLIKTVPPEGVDESLYADTATYFAGVRGARAAGTWFAPDHTLPTTYRYNSLNQVVTQKSPDGAFSQFWYDRLGRLVISQNAKQADQSNYSYTLYDEIGRITEVGQKQQTIAMLQATSSNPQALYNWLHNTTGFNQVTRTVYDKVATLPVVTGSTAATFRQKGYTMRNRVSHTVFYNSLAVNGGNQPLYDDYTSGSYYSYDIHGNVDTLLQDYRAGIMQQKGLNRYKLVAYNYDLISGKVNEVHYQPGERDQLYHRYEYDAENRITDVYTTFKKEFVGQKSLEDHEAFYQYYKHGPLAKTILGQQQVQGVDYAYTLHGWLKGVNLDSTLEDPITARDAYSFSLHYYNGDYAAINTAGTPTLINASGNVEFRPLYNGNIGAMAVNIKKFNTPLVYNYGYDQLNRLVSMDAFDGWNPAGNIFAPNKLQDYKERVSYDANGNILTYERNGQAESSGLLMDKFTYQYERTAGGRLATNKLRYVYDDVQGNNYGGDLKTGTPLTLPQVQEDKRPTQGSDNYGYDAIGNLIKDTKEGITNISWTVYGKIETITKANGQTIAYSYDAGGNRISKIVTKDAIATTTWYVRDAQGNVMGIYTHKNSVLSLSEQHLYGSSRLGIWNRNMSMEAPLPTPVNAGGIGEVNTTTFDRGTKLFELSNHLGNVLVTVSDKKRGVDENADGIVDHYLPDITTAQDYYPFGMLMPGRRGTLGSNGVWTGTGGRNGLLANLSVTNRSGNTPSEYKATVDIEFVGEFVSGDGDAFEAFITTDDGSESGSGMASDAGGYRYGFNGKEQDDEVSGEGNLYDYGFRIYNPRLGKFLSVDPLMQKYPELTPYQFASNTPIQAVDLDGAESMFGWSIGLTPEQTAQAADAWNKQNVKLVNGTASGVKKSVVKLWNAIIHPWETIKSIGSFLEEATLDMSTVKVAPSPNLDAQAKDFKERVINGDTYTRSEYLSEVGTDILLTKGISKGFTVLKGMALAERMAARTNFVAAKYAAAIEKYGPNHIDFTKPVSEVGNSGSLVNGKNLVQWRDPSNPNASPFFTYDGVDPSRLGIPKTHTQKYNVALTGQHTFLESTANKVKAFSPQKDPGVNGMYNGGGAQLYSEEAAKTATFTPAKQ
jgi:RHS repeat-associated protein